MRNSSQRDAILEELIGRKDHPTAETIYRDLKSAWPKLSLGTVYRNLAQLCEAGMAQRVQTGGAVHFDGDTSRHYHFICEECDAVLDIPNPISGLRELQFKGKITRCEIYLVGICPDCLNSPVDDDARVHIKESI